MAETETRFTLPEGALRERLETAAREDATTPDQLIAQAVEALLEKRSSERPWDTVFGNRAVEDGLDEDQVNDLVNAAIASSREKRRAGGQ